MTPERTVGLGRTVGFEWTGDSDGQRNLDGPRNSDGVWCSDVQLNLDGRWDLGRMWDSDGHWGLKGLGSSGYVLITYWIERELGRIVTPVRSSRPGSTGVLGVRFNFVGNVFF